MKFSCYLAIVLTSSAWAWNHEMYSNGKISPFSEKKHPPCEEVMNSPPAIFMSKFLVTVGLPVQNGSTIIYPPQPFSEDSRCIMCKVRLFKSSYVGPLNESCILPEREKYVQFMIWKGLKAGFRMEYEWKAYILPKTSPEHVYIPVGGSKVNSGLRRKRNLELCSFPDELETAALDCNIYPSYVKCTQMCAFGYTLQSGITQHMKCLKKENVWRPVGFIECQPFVDCTVALTSGGHAKCSYMSLKSPPECKVSCAAYEDKDEVPSNTYTCNIEGKWDPPLPFCANPGQGLLLATAPKKKLHD